MGSKGSRVRFGAWLFREQMLALVLGIGVALVLLYAASGIIYLPQVLRSRTPRSDEFADDWLGYRRVPQFKSLLVSGAVQSTDEWGRRVTVQPPEDEFQTFAIFGIDSMVYGIGVGDEDTIPSSVAAAISGSNIKVYNYAVGEYDPSNFLALMTDPRFPPGVRERSGFVVYFCFDYHVSRVVGWPLLVVPNDPTVRYPRYVRGADGNLRRDGYLKTVINWPDEAPHWLPFTHHRQIYLTLTQKAEYRRLAADVILQTKVEFERRFESRGFFVVFLYRLPKMQRLLEERGVVCFDYDGILSAERCGAEPCLQPHDVHPTASGNRLIAARLAADLARVGVVQAR
jgi:hypothetical protein